MDEATMASKVQEMEKAINKLQTTMASVMAEHAASQQKMKRRIFSLETDLNDKSEFYSTKEKKIEK